LVPNTPSLSYRYWIWKQHERAKDIAVGSLSSWLRLNRSVHLWGSQATTTISLKDKVAASDRAVSLMGSQCLIKLLATLLSLALVPSSLFSHLSWWVFLIFSELFFPFSFQYLVFG
jgi:hypothetical protein